MAVKTIPHWLALGAMLAAAGCDRRAPFEAIEPEPIDLTAPPSDSPEAGACSATEDSPAVIETVTEQVVEKPAEYTADGTLLFPAVIRTETHQSIVAPRRPLRFETLCDDQLTPDLLRSLQRALKARKLYSGPVNGEMTEDTRAAIRAYQAPQGLDSATLSLGAARQLGLVAMPRQK